MYGEAFLRVPSHAIYIFSDGGNAILIITFYASFKCFGNHYCDLGIREQGKEVLYSY